MTISLTSKFVRAHNVNVSVTNSQSLVWLMKLIYEFWGFCINGDTSLTVPTGFPTNGINMPASFQSGSLLKSGTSGYTIAGESIFYDSSANFTSGSSIVNKQLVTWKPGSTSNDDNVYRIVKIISSQSIQVDTNTGATPYSGSLIPLFTSRSSINYRILDFESTIATSTYASGNYMILNLSGASLVNANQLSPQVKIAFTNASTFDHIGISLSPSGSWNGSTFTDETAVSSADWCNGTTGTGHISLWGASDYFICHYRGSWCNAAAMIHVEVPERIYPQSNDPNPIIGLLYNNSSITTTSTTVGYGGGWFTRHPPTGDTVGLVTLAHSPLGDYFPALIFTNLYELAGASNGRYNNSFYNPVTDQFLISDVIYAQELLDKFCMARFRARRWRVMAANIVPLYTRLGLNGEYIYVGGTVMLPWDNAILPYNLLRSGD